MVLRLDNAGDPHKLYLLSPKKVYANFLAYKLVSSRFGVCKDKLASDKEEQVHVWVSSEVSKRVAEDADPGWLPVGHL